MKDLDHNILSEKYNQVLSEQPQQKTRVPGQQQPPRPVQPTASNATNQQVQHGQPQAVPNQQWQQAQAQPAQPAPGSNLSSRAYAAQLGTGGGAHAPVQQPARQPQQPQQTPEQIFQQQKQQQLQQQQQQRFPQPAAPASQPAARSQQPAAPVNQNPLGTGQTPVPAGYDPRRGLSTPAVQTAKDQYGQEYEVPRVHPATGEVGGWNANAQAQQAADFKQQQQDKQSDTSTYNPATDFSGTPPDVELRKDPETGLPVQSIQPIQPTHAAGLIPDEQINKIKSPDLRKTARKQNADKQAAHDARQAELNPLIMTPGGPIPGQIKSVEQPNDPDALPGFSHLPSYDDEMTTSQAEIDENEKQKAAAAKAKQDKEYAAQRVAGDKQDASAAEIMDGADTTPNIQVDSQGRAISPTNQGPHGSGAVNPEAPLALGPGSDKPAPKPAPEEKQSVYKAKPGEMDEFFKARKEQELATDPNRPIGSVGSNAAALDAAKRYASAPEVSPGEHDRSFMGVPAAEGDPTIDPMTGQEIGPQGPAPLPGQKEYDAANAAYQQDFKDKGIDVDPEYHKKAQEEDPSYMAPPHADTFVPGEVPSTPLPGVSVPQRQTGFDAQQGLNGSALPDANDKAPVPPTAPPPAAPAPTPDPPTAEVEPFPTPDEVQRDTIGGVPHSFIKDNEGNGRWIDDNDVEAYQLELDDAAATDAKAKTAEDDAEAQNQRFGQATADAINKDRNQSDFQKLRQRFSNFFKTRQQKQDDWNTRVRKGAENLKPPIPTQIPKPSNQNVAPKPAIEPFPSPPQVDPSIPPADPSAPPAVSAPGEVPLVTPKIKRDEPDIDDAFSFDDKTVEQLKAIKAANKNALPPKK